MDQARKKQLAVTGLLLSAIVIALIVFAIVGQKPSNKNPAEQGPLVIQNSSALSSVLLNNQYNAVQFDLSAFIQQRVKATAHQATINSVAIQPDGSIGFNVVVDSQPQYTFSEKIDRHIFNQLTVSISKYSYVKTISVY